MYDRLQWRRGEMKGGEERKGKGNRVGKIGGVE